MLKALHVKNLALIEEADLTFDKGFTVFSGETGAGKSILLESIHLALGGRASKDLIRNGKEFALVELTFEPDEKALNQLKELDIYPEDNDIIIQRKVTADKSVIRVNGETVNTSFAREIGELLLDIHGQNEHQSLLKKSNQLNILDLYGKEEITELKAAIKEKYSEYRQVIKLLEESNLDEAARLRELDYLEYEINEIEGANIKEGEEEELSALYVKLSNARNIIEVMGAAYDLIGGGSNSCEESIGNAARRLGAVSEFDSSINEIYNQVLILESEISELSRSVSGYLDSFSLDEETLRDTADRLDTIRNIEKKYGATVSDINKHLVEAKERRDELLKMSETRDKAEGDKNRLTKELKKLSDELTIRRTKIKERLEKEITLHLNELNFLHVCFEIRLTKLDDFTSNGMDDAAYMISMNKGELAKPLELVASGGELSRIMLAIKTVLGDLDTIGTQIFDEIDAGISGITASCVAKKLSQIGLKRQVLCISHLPQIVAAADNHYLIEKRIVEDKTITRVDKLDEEGSIKEIARILGGDLISESTLISAKELKKLSKI